MLGLPERHLTCEAHHRNTLHAGAPERIHLLVDRHQQRRRLVGPHHTGRMRIERHRRRHPAPLARPTTDAVDDLHVPAMQPVEVAERQYRAAASVAGRRRGNGHVAWALRYGRFAMGSMGDGQWAMGDGGRSSITQVHHEPIIGQLHSRGQPGAGGGVTEVMTHVREVHLAGADAAAPPRRPRPARSASDDAGRAAHR